MHPTRGDSLKTDSWIETKRKTAGISDHLGPGCEYAGKKNDNITRTRNDKLQAVHLSCEDRVINWKDVNRQVDNAWVNIFLLGLMERRPQNTHAILLKQSCCKALIRHSFKVVSKKKKKKHL